VAEEPLVQLCLFTIDGLYLCDLGLSVYIVMVSFVGSLVLVIGLFFGVSLLYALIDLTGRPAFLYKYKIQEEPVRNCEP